MTAAKKPGLRDRLLERKRPSLSVPLAVEDVTAPSRDVVLAEEAWRTVQLGQGSERQQRIKEARAEVDTAMARLDACYVHVTVTALPPADFEKLVAQHPAREKEDEAWNAETFPRALFLACADEDLSAEEWGTFLDERCSQAERDTLLLAAQQINVRAPDVAVPKD